MVRRPPEWAEGRDDGRQHVEAVGHPGHDHDKAGDAGRAGAAKDRGQRERDPAEEHGKEADPESEADRRQRRDLVAQGGVPEGVGVRRRRECEDRHRQPEQRQVRGKLLERDPALAERRRGDEVEAAPAGLAGQRGRERKIDHSAVPRAKIAPYFQLM